MTVQYRCSFCGTPRDDVRKLIAGPGVYICNECVDTCAQNFSGGSRWQEERRAWIDYPPMSPWPRQRQSHLGDDIACSFCGKVEPEVQRLVQGGARPNTFICDECVGLCQIIMREPPSGPTAMRRATSQPRRRFRRPSQLAHPHNTRRF